MEIFVNIVEGQDFLKISYPCNEHDYEKFIRETGSWFDSEMDDKIIKIANLLGFDLKSSGVNSNNHTREIIFEKNQDFTKIEKVIADLEKESILKTLRFRLHRAILTQNRRIL